MTDAERTRVFSNTAPSAALPDLTHRIHFARSPGRRWGAAESTAYALHSAVVFPIAAAIVVAAAIKTAFGVNWGLQEAGRWVGTGMLVLALTLAVTNWFARRPWHQRRRSLPALPDASFRLQCVGSPEELAQIGALCDVPFEPRKYWTPVGVPTAPVMSKWRILTVVLALVVSFYTWWVIRAPDSSRYVFVMGAFAVVYLFLAVVAPTYIGVMPGRLALLHYLPVGPAQGCEFDLRTARVLVDLHAYVIALADEAGQPLVSFSYAAAPRRRELGYYVFLAALSTYEPPTV